MDIEVVKDSSLGLYPTGGGCCDLHVTITVDPDMSPAMQRRNVIHEALEACLGYAMPHDKLCDIEYVICQALDEWEGLSSSPAEEK